MMMLLVVCAVTLRDGIIATPTNYIWPQIIFFNKLDLFMELQKLIFIRVIIYVKL